MPATMLPSHPPDPAQGSLPLLLERETAERDRALAILRTASQRLQAVRTQGEQLVAYRDEYRKRWQSQFGKSGSPEILRCYQSFSDRLDQAIAQQRTQLQQAEQTEARARESLAAQELRVASVRKLMERREAEAKRAQDRREQRQSDEHAQRASERGAERNPDWGGKGIAVTRW